MPLTGDQICPGVNVVKPLFVTEEEGDFIWDISFATSPEGENLVKFKVDNPFNTPADVYVQYHENSVGVLGALDAKCVQSPLQPGCFPGASEITAVCLSLDGKKPFTVVTIFFVTADSEIIGSVATVPECCYETPRQGPIGKVAYTFEIYCGC